MATLETQTLIEAPTGRVPASSAAPSAPPEVRGGALASVLPRQHGAWSILLIGYLLGALAFPRASAAAAALALGALGVVAALALAGLIPPWAPLALAPVTAKALLGLRRGGDAPPVIRALGFIELAHSLLFAALVLLAYRTAA